MFQLSFFIGDFKITEQKPVEEHRLWKYKRIRRCFTMADDNRGSPEMESAHFRRFNNDIVPGTVAIKFIQIVREARNEVVVNTIASKIDGDDCAKLLKTVYRTRQLITKLHSIV